MSARSSPERDSASAIATAGADDAPEDCVACGTCCFSRLATYVRVTGDDHARLGDHAEDLVVFVENRAYMRMVDGHCAALTLDAEAGRFLCRVYDARPEACRALDRGSPACAGERTTKGERPRAALVALRSGRADTAP